MQFTRYPRLYCQVAWGPALLGGIDIGHDMLRKMQHRAWPGRRTSCILLRLGIVRTHGLCLSEYDMRSAIVNVSREGVQTVSGGCSDETSVQTRQLKKTNTVYFLSKKAVAFSSPPHSVTCRQSGAWCHHAQRQDHADHPIDSRPPVPEEERSEQQKQAYQRGRIRGAMNTGNPQPGNYFALRRQYGEPKLEPNDGGTR